MYPIYILAALCVYLMVDKHIERHRAAKREQELLNRLMSRDFVNYAYGESIIGEAKTDGSGEAYDLDILPVT